MSDNNPVNDMVIYLQSIARNKLNPYPPKVDMKSALILSKFAFDDSFGMEGNLCHDLNIGYPEIQKLFLNQVHQDIKHALESVANSVVTLIAVRND